MGIVTTVRGLSSVKGEQVSGTCRKLPLNCLSMGNQLWTTLRRIELYIEIFGEVSTTSMSKPCLSGKGRLVMSYKGRSVRHSGSHCRLNVSEGLNRVTVKQYRAKLGRVISRVTMV